MRNSVLNTLKNTCYRNLVVDIDYLGKIIDNTIQKLVNKVIFQQLFYPSGESARVVKLAQISQSVNTSVEKGGTVQDFLRSISLPTGAIWLSTIATFPATLKACQFYQIVLSTTIPVFRALKMPRIKKGKRGSNRSGK